MQPTDVPEPSAKSNRSNGLSRRDAAKRYGRLIARYLLRGAATAAGGSLFTLLAFWIEHHI